MASETLAERLHSVENRLDDLQRQIDERLPSGNTKSKGGWRAIVGTFEKDPIYDEAMRLGREWRDSQRDETDE